MKRFGKLLIANPRLPGPFHKSVIYIYQDHPEKGTSGVVLNKNTGLPIRRIMNDKGIIYPNGIDKLHHGGPCEQNALIMLHSAEWTSKNTFSVGNGLALSSDDFMFEKMSQGDVPCYYRVFNGYSGWTAGQLDAEIAGTNGYSKASWLIADASDSLIFECDNEEQWVNALGTVSNNIFDKYFE